MKDYLKDPYPLDGGVPRGPGEVLKLSGELHALIIRERLTPGDAMALLHNTIAERLWLDKMPEEKVPEILERAKTLVQSIYNAILRDQGGMRR